MRKPKPARSEFQNPLEDGLYIAATPIGNARDISLRTLEVLGGCDLILAEDTRNTAKLLALHEEQQMTLQKNFELRRELYVRGRITKESLAEAERALTEAIVRVYEDRRWLAEADRAMEEHSATLQSRDGTQ